MIIPFLYHLSYSVLLYLNIIILDINLKCVSITISLGAFSAGQPTHNENLVTLINSSPIFIELPIWRLVNRLKILLIWEKLIYLVIKRFYTYSQNPILVTEIQKEETKTYSWFLLKIIQDFHANFMKVEDFIAEFNHFKSVVVLKIKQILFYHLSCEHIYTHLLRKLILFFLIFCCLLSCPFVYTWEICLCRRSLSNAINWFWYWNNAIFLTTSPFQGIVVLDIDLLT